LLLCDSPQIRHLWFQQEVLLLAVTGIAVLGVFVEVNWGLRVDTSRYVCLYIQKGFGAYPTSYPLISED